MNPDEHEQIPCPDGIHGCAVFHYRKKVKKMSLRDHGDKTDECLHAQVIPTLDGHKCQYCGKRF